MNAVGVVAVLFTAPSPSGSAARTSSVHILASFLSKFCREQLADSTYILLSRYKEVNQKLNEFYIIFILILWK